MELKDILNVEKELGIDFNNKELLKRSFVHRSFYHEFDSIKENYERLEFLGDSVIGLIVSEYLYEKFPLYAEGELSQVKAVLISESMLSKVANTLDLGKYMLLGKGEDLSGGRRKPSLLADTLEALVGAIYLDQGLNCARDFVIEQIGPSVEQLNKNGALDLDYKSAFQEAAQGRIKETPVYRVIAEEGPDHNRTFTVEVLCGDKVYGVGTGTGKKEAQQMAARQGLKVLRKK